RKPVGERRQAHRLGRRALQPQRQHGLPKLFALAAGIARYDCSHSGSPGRRHSIRRTLQTYLLSFMVAAAPRRSVSVTASGRETKVACRVNCNGWFGAGGITLTTRAATNPVNVA